MNRNNINNGIHLIYTAITRFFIFAAIPVSMSSCGDGDSRIVQTLDAADSIMIENPDSAERLLERIGDVVTADAGKSTRMRHLLLLADAKNKNFKQMPSDTLFKDVIDYYDKHGNNNERMRAYYLMGCIYRDRKEAPEAIIWYEKATECADTTAADCNYAFLYRIYGQMADVYFKVDLYKEEIQAAMKAQRYALKANEISGYIRAYELLIRPYANLGDTSLVYQITDNAVELYKYYGMYEEAADAYTTAIRMALYQKKINEAGYMMQIFENESGAFDNEHHIEKGREMYYYTKGLYMEEINKLDSAEFFYRMLLKYGYDHAAYYGLISVYRKKNDLDSIVKFSKLSEDAYERYVQASQAETVIKMSSLYNYTRNQKIAEAMTGEARRKQNIIYFVIIIAGVIICLSGAKYRQYKLKNEEEIIRLNDNYVEAVEKIQALETEIDMLQKDQKALLTEKQQNIEALNVMIENYKDQYNNMECNEKEKMLFNNSVTKDFKQMSVPKLGTRKPTPNDWKRLLAILKIYHTSLYNMINDKLPQQELYICILTRLDFSNKEISILLETSPQRITNAKASVNEKLFGDKNARALKDNLKGYR